MPRHAFSVDFGIADGARLSVRGRAWLRSGMRYTPTVLGDVDGDGAYDDIAFVADPEAAATPAASAAEMSELLRHAPASARRCLAAQRGRIADRNGCAGAWAGGLDLQTRVTHPWLSRLGGLEIDVINAGGAPDRLLRGEAGRRGWGDQSAPDPVLLVPTSFDPEARWRQAVDSASARLVAFLQQVSDTVPEAEVAAGVKRTREEIGEATRDVGRALGEILTPDQLGRLPRRLVAWVTGRFEGGIAPF